MYPWILYHRGEIHKNISYELLWGQKQGIAGEFWWASLLHELTNAHVFHKAPASFPCFLKIFDSEYETAKPCFISLSLLSSECDLIIAKPWSLMITLIPSCASHSSCEPHSGPESIKYKQQGYLNKNALLQWFCNVNTFLLWKPGSSIGLHSLQNEVSTRNVFIVRNDQV